MEVRKLRIGIMTPQELKLGNWIECEGQYVLLTHISVDSPVEIMRGIPLTDDILLRLVFRKQDNEYEAGHPDYCEWLERNFPVIGCVYQSDTKDCLLVEINGEELRIEYLHQLQNFHYALAGEELDIDLTEK